MLSSAWSLGPEVLDCLSSAMTDSVDDTWVVLATDAGYAGPLAVALRSIDELLAGEQAVTAVVLASAVPPAVRERVVDGLRRLQVRWHDVDITRHNGLPVPIDHLTMASYHRLLLGDVLPADVGRAIYLDVDILARRDITELARVPLDGRLLGACPDVHAPRLGWNTGLPGWRELGLDPRAPNLNAGVLVVDLPQWRATGVAAQVAEYLRDRASSGSPVRLADQDGLNAVASDRWCEIDLCWNAQNYLVQDECWADAYLDPTQLEAARRDPWIVHYHYAKPWQTTPDASLWDGWWWEVAGRTAMPFTPPAARSRPRRYLRCARRRLGAAAAALRGHH